MASSEIGLANAIIAAAKEQGQEPDRRWLNVPLLPEAQEIMKVDAWLSINADAALWYRGLATLKDDPAGGRAVLIDTGMLASVYKGRASALEINGNTLTAHDADGKVTLQ